MHNCKILICILYDVLVQSTCSAIKSTPALKGVADASRGHSKLESAQIIVTLYQEESAAVFEQLRQMSQLADILSAQRGYRASIPVACTA